MRKTGRRISMALGLLAAFALWTAAVSFVDVRAIGPMDSSVGLAAMNGFVHGLTGVHFALYTITDWLGLVPVAVGFGFAVLGLVQWIRRRSILKVDFSLLALGGFYLLVLAAYLFFESHVVNYRPVLIGGYLEASYPSSTTMMALCVMPTAAMQLDWRVKASVVRKFIWAVTDLFTAFMVIGRLISGVHWFSDIVGGILLSAALVLFYRAMADMKRTGV